MNFVMFSFVGHVVNLQLKQDETGLPVRGGLDGCSQMS